MSTLGFLGSEYSNDYITQLRENPKSIKKKEECNDLI